MSWKTREEIVAWEKKYNPNFKWTEEEFDNMYFLQQLQTFYYQEFDLPITEEALIKEGFKWEELTEIDDCGYYEPEVLKYNALVKDNYELRKNNQGNFYRSYSLGCMGWDNVELKNFQSLQINYIYDNWFSKKLNPENFK